MFLGLLKKHNPSDIHRLDDTCLIETSFVTALMSLCSLMTTMMMIGLKMTKVSSLERRPLDYSHIYGIIVLSTIVFGENISHSVQVA